MTRRERLERKLEKRQEWAGKAAVQSDASFYQAKKLTDQIPLGQPILVGHHSERHARRDAERIQNGLARGVERAKMADHHLSAASGIAHQLDTSIFSDDPDAVEAIEAKVAKLEEQQAKMKAVNATIRRHAKAGSATQVDALVLLGYPRGVAARFLAPDDYGRIGYPSYSLTNNSGNIRRLKLRLAEIKARQERQTRAEAAGVLIEGGKWVRVTFPHKPEPEVLEALRGTGFVWRGGSWVGKREALPSCLQEQQEDITKRETPHARRGEGL